MIGNFNKLNYNENLITFSFSESTRMKYDGCAQYKPNNITKLHTSSSTQRKCYQSVSRGYKVFFVRDCVLNTRISPLFL